MGGAKLLVDKKDYAKASDVLIEGGFMVSNDEVQESVVIDFLDYLTPMIPGLHKLPLELRLVVVSFILISIPFGLAFFFSL